jgi:energy-coupling factor transporter ATP-binding protein EcfA2
MAKSDIKHLSKIEVKDLFGIFNYNIPSDTSDLSLHSGTMLLYGDNGCGKTTILRLVFHTLARGERAGHRTYLSKTKFRQLKLIFSDGTIVLVKKKSKDLLGTFDMILSKPDKPDISYTFEAEEDYRIPVKEHETDSYYNLLSALSELGLSLYFLTDTRTIMVDQPKVISSQYPGTILTEDDIRYREMLIETRKRKIIEPEEIARELVRHSVNRVVSEIRNQSINASSRSESNVNALYREIIKRIVGSPEKKIDLDKEKKSIIKRIEELQKNSVRFARFGLLPKFIVKEILSNVKNTPDHNMEILSNVLTPYLDSLESKFNTLSSLQKRLELFVDTINGFYQGKKIHFDVRSGLSIQSEVRELIQPEDLSSGERQLLLLFCNTMITLNTPSLVLIDEPELSLNIKWQRSLISSLLDFILDSPIQFIFATHSFEILSKYIDHVTKLENIVDSTNN